LNYAIKQRNFAIAAKPGMIINEDNMRLLYIFGTQYAFDMDFLDSGN
jgi:hypothetical protein